MSLFDESTFDPVIGCAPVGQAVETAVSDGWGVATASFDLERRYRFRLSRVWDPKLGRCCFLMLNPSTADAFKVDPTVARCLRFASDWGCGALEVVNLFALRSTDPKGLQAKGVEPVGAGNDDAIVAAVTAADVTVCAWGVNGALWGRAAAVLALLDGRVLHALAFTKHGEPRHPLYLRSDLTPIPLTTNTRMR